MTEPLVEYWELYTSSMKCGRAERALNAALARAAKKMTSEFRKRKLRAGDDESIGRLIAELRDKIMEPVMGKYSEYGASDTEPRYHAGQGLNNAAKDYFGVPRSEDKSEWGDYL